MILSRYSESRGYIKAPTLHHGFCCKPMKMGGATAQKGVICNRNLFTTEDYQALTTIQMLAEEILMWAQR